MKKVIILAGGEGIRLRPVTYEIPKPLVPVKKKPIINHIINFFERHGISQIGVIISKKDFEDFNVWKNTWKNSFNAQIDLFLKELGVETFSGLQVVKDWIGADSFIVTNGDCLMDFDFSLLNNFHDRNNFLLSAPLLNVNTSGNYGLCVLDGIHVRQFLISNVLAGTKLICGGPYILNPAIFKYDEPDNKLMGIERNLLPKLIKDNKIIAIEIKESRFFDCGTLENWERAIKEW